MVVYHMLSCPVKILNCCGEGDSEHSESGLMFVWTIYSEPMNLL